MASMQRVLLPIHPVSLLPVANRVALARWNHDHDAHQSRDVHRGQGFMTVGITRTIAPSKASTPGEKPRNRLHAQALE